LKIIDAGVDYDFSKYKDLIHAKVGRGTSSFLNGNAMSKTQLNACFLQGREIVKRLHLQGCNIVGFGEMGIGNTSSASLLMSVLCEYPIEDCVGTGSGLNTQQLAHKISILKMVLEKHPKPKCVEDAIVQFGGFEIAQIAAGMLSAFEKNMLILVDGFISSVAFLCAFKLNSQIRSHAFFCHLSSEQGHKILLDYLQVSPLLNFEMRLGEGSGCALVFPIIKSSVLFINEMASFESAGVSKKV
jgi:nicotinate-nucleotide--dimethylbenzimidazole phosphoribosyltransferase